MRKYARAASPEAMLHDQWQDRTSKLDRNRPHLEQRIAEATRWITTHPDHLRDDDQLRLKKLLARSPELTAATTHVRTFATGMTNRAEERLRE